MSVPSLSARMKWYFFLSLLFMMLHKVESYRTHEWEFAPGYRYVLSLGFDHGPLLFLTFVSILFLGLFWCFLIMAWRWGQWLLLTVWGLTFLLEWHHVWRTLQAGEYYSGLITALLYISFGILYWMEYGKHFLTTNKTKAGNSPVGR